MKIALAPDSFKGSLSAPQVCRALEIGARRVYPTAEFIAVPLADGGEGTLDVLMTGTDGRLKTCPVRGPLGETVEAHWGILPDGRAVIEMAQASGLQLIEPGQRDALAASTFGTGQLIKAALDAGCRDIIVAIGGSATTDGGLGALNALGLYARDERDRVLAAGGGALKDLVALDPKFLDARLQKTKFTVLCDVNNPLYGPDGAAHIYAAQKGADAAETERLDAGLRCLAEVTANLVGHDYSSHAGAGAAGGLGFGLLAFCQAELSSGISVVLEATQLEQKIAGADLVLTGEGTLDAQTLHGKTVAGICRLARAHRVPVIALGGAVRLNGMQMDELGLVAAFSLCDGPRTLKFCVGNSASLLADATERALRVWQYARRVN